MSLVKQIILISAFIMKKALQQSGICNILKIKQTCRGRECTRETTNKILKIFFKIVTSLRPLLLQLLESGHEPDSLQKFQPVLQMYKLP